MKQDNMLAMILAGGRGTRLHDLTKKVAKPAVSYGGKYRIIDFPLSNCANSGIDIVGVLTQYESVLLNSYAAAGRRWGLDAKDSGVYILPPREKADTGLDVYRGTADAISQNIDFIDSYSPEYLLILSGDHIYKMDYDKMLEYHKANHADATIAVIEVPMKEASRFGIMNTNETGRIVEFEEKPEKPKSNLASMGIYIFNWKLLRKMLLADMKNPESSHDFGKDIIPTMLADEKTLFAYKFKGYWKDVGTIDSLWEANMDLLSKNNALDLNDSSWKIYTEDVTALPQFVGADADIDRAFITQGCVINGTVKNSVLFTGVKVATGAKVIDSVLMPGVEVAEGAVVTRALVADKVKIGKNAVVGSADSENIELVAKRVKGEE
ncbi:glucose-1-phosphate adenylyltransferase [[Ruminococcus] lactaris]|uniref:Glucose-1-phosphate adenylyltransferase n=1 Tax=[Ruminococcus] lactaris ATCC 29176 TaxID=471875 RepID=B5CNS3_9FIRM|nr:glucose-1-phosphate adenylyltransferase [[Ruminococcus] lactaris]EDY33106.1 glucose-1-phosphate adenylyltransferase [[Ruminococcus] lactaris ATCC 29176]UWP65390.1 glucose-1-phosphate adenylyltransferase [[Ruminococcus] lactaris ATCC 29176]